MYANKLTIPSDGNELTLVEVIKKGKETLIRYRYSNSKTKKDSLLDLTEIEYNNMLRRGISTKTESNNI